MLFRQSIELAFKLIFVREYVKKIDGHNLIDLLKEIRNQ